MDQSISQLNSSSGSNSPIVPMIVSVVVTAIVFGGGVFLRMNQKQQIMNDEIASVRNQLDHLKQVSSTPPPTTTNKNITTPPQPNLEAYQANQAKIAELKANPKATVDDIYDLQQVMSFSERKDLFETARKRVVEGSIEGMQFDLVFDWKKGNWIHFTVIPENVNTDIAQLYLEKVGNHWQAYGPGTAFPDLYEQHPELFKQQ